MLDLDFLIFGQKIVRQFRTFWQFWFSVARLTKVPLNKKNGWNRRFSTFSRVFLYKYMTFQHKEKSNRHHTRQKMAMWAFLTYISSYVFLVQNTWLPRLAKFVPKWKCISMQIFAYLRLKNRKKSGNRKIEPRFMLDLDFCKLL